MSNIDFINVLKQFLLKQNIFDDAPKSIQDIDNVAGVGYITLHNILYSFQDILIKGRRWSALGKFATGYNLRVMGDYACTLFRRDSRAIYHPQLPNGATITQFQIQIAKVNIQTDNTFTSKLRRHIWDRPYSVQTMAEISRSGIIHPDTDGKIIVNDISNPVVSDNYVYSVECTQTADRETLIYYVALIYD